MAQSFFHRPLAGGTEMRAGLIPRTDRRLVPFRRLAVGVTLLLGRQSVVRGDRRRDISSGSRWACGRALVTARLRSSPGRIPPVRWRTRRPRARGRLVGGHVHVPPDAVRGVGSPDWVASSFGWVLPGSGIAVRPLPRLIHRRRFTVLCWSRDGTAPAPLACGWPFRRTGPLRGGRRRRCRPHRLPLLAFACRLILGPTS